MGNCAPIRAGPPTVARMIPGVCWGKRKVGVGSRRRRDLLELLGSFLGAGERDREKEKKGRVAYRVKNVGRTVIFLSLSICQVVNSSENRRDRFTKGILSVDSVNSRLFDQ